jgi:hypothetical protein
LQGDLVCGQRRRADHAHQQRGGCEHAELQQERARDRRTDLEKLGKQGPVGAPEAPEHAILLEGALRIAHPDRRRTHADIDQRRREAGAQEVELWQAEGAIDQGIGQQQVGRNGGQSDPQRRLRPIDRAHEIAEGYERPARHQAPREAVEIAAGQRRSLRRLPELNQNVPAPQLQGHARNAEHQRSPQADAQRPPHDAGLARAERLRGERRHRRHDAHAHCEGGEQHGMRERRRRHHLVAQATKQHQVGRHHGDLAKLGDGHRPGQTHRVDDLRAPSRPWRRQLHAGGDVCRL